MRGCFPPPIWGPQASRLGVNDYGWVVGEQFTQSVSTSARHLVQNVALNPRLSGISHPFVWSQQTGIVMLGGAVTISGINQKGQIVGVAAVGEEIHGVMLTGD